MLVGRGLESLSRNSVSSEDKVLIISDNQFKSLESLSFLHDVEEIVADNNCIQEPINIPKLLKLRTLSLNKNQIGDLEMLLDELVENTPNLVFLSLLGNPISPDLIHKYLSIISDGHDYINSGDEQREPIEFNLKPVENIEGNGDDGEYQRYRLRILYRLPQLQFIDSAEVTEMERAEAVRKGKFLQIRKLDNSLIDNGSKTSSLGYLYNNRVVEWITNIAVKNELNNENLSPLTENAKKKVSKVCFGKSQYVYKGRYSEGNRFIRNYDL